MLGERCLYKWMIVKRIDAGSSALLTPSSVYSAVAGFLTLIVLTNLNHLIMLTLPLSPSTSSSRSLSPMSSITSLASPTPTRSPTSSLSPVAQKTPYPHDPNQSRLPSRDRIEHAVEYLADSEASSPELAGMTLPSEVGCPPFMPSQADRS